MDQCCTFQTRKAHCQAQPIPLRSARAATQHSHTREIPAQERSGTASSFVLCFLSKQQRLTVLYLRSTSASCFSFTLFMPGGRRPGQLQGRVGTLRCAAAVTSAAS